MHFSNFLVFQFGFISWLDLFFCGAQAGEGIHQEVCCQDGPSTRHVCVALRCSSLGLAQCRPMGHQSLAPANTGPARPMGLRKACEGRPRGPSPVQTLPSGRADLAQCRWSAGHTVRGLVVSHFTFFRDSSFRDIFSGTKFQLF